MQSSKESKTQMVRGVGRPKKDLDGERRFRRDIANNHERKRMQSINDGIKALRYILRHKDIDKLSKATVLLRTAEYVIHLESRLSILVEENFRLKCLTKELIQKQVKTSITVQQLLFGSQKGITTTSEELSSNSNDSDIKTNILENTYEAIDLSVYPKGNA